MPKTFEVTILGVNSAIPVHKRHPSCQIINFDNELFMVDCGEGTQIQISRYKIKSNKISHIFISHLHGDHCYGLPGLLSSFSLGRRTKKLSLHGPKGIKKFIDTIFEVSQAHLSYTLDIIEYDTEISNSIPMKDSFSVTTFPMKHRIPTMGFRFNENIVSLNINAEKIKEHLLTVDEIKTAKKGKNIVRKEKTIPFEEVTFLPEKPRSYSYCSDTVYDLELVPFIKESSLLYHETTYLDDLTHLAKERMHTTLGQALDIAKRSNIDKMIVGHFSSRYSDTSIFLKEGKDHIQTLYVGEEGITYTV